MTSGDLKETGRSEVRWPVLEYPLGLVCIGLLAGLTLLTCLDVAGRYWFNAPVNGAYELTQMMLGALIFAALPMTTARGDHIEVDLLASAVGRAGRRLLHAFGHLVSALVLFVLSWRVWVHADRLSEDGAVTNSLALPLAPVGYFAALACALSGVIALLRIFGGRRRDERAGA